MNNHPYKGTAPICMTCYKPKDHPIHLSLGITQKEIVNHVFRGSTLICEICLKHKEDTIHRQEQAMIIPSGVIAVAITCNGHVCPQCSRNWEHDYTCGKGPRESGLCKPCAQQSAAEINRPANIAEISKDAIGKNGLTGREAMEIRVEHESFVVLKIIHKEDGSERENWRELLGEHIADIDRQIERLKNKKIATYQAKADQEEKDLLKLTDEEREQYKRDAVRLKKKNEPKVEKANAERQSAREKTISQLMKLTGKDRDTVERMLKA